MSSSALIEVGSATRPSRTDPRRRWFRTRGVDLYVWFDESDQPFAFQLCYEKGVQEFALTWEAEHGFSHTNVDSGSGAGAGMHTSSQLLVGSSDPDLAHIKHVFEHVSDGLPSAVRALVSDALELYPKSPTAPGRRPILYKGVVSRLAPLLTWQSALWAVVLFVALATLAKGVGVRAQDSVQAITLLITFLLIPAVYAGLIRLSARVFRISGLGWYYAFPFAFVVTVLFLAAGIALRRLEITAPMLVSIAITFTAHVVLGVGFFRNRVRGADGLPLGLAGAVKLMTLACVLFFGVGGVFNAVRTALGP